MGIEETSTAASARWTLRDLPFVGRLVLSVFLISVGIGYFSALVQLHFQHAAAGQLLPGPPEVEGAYHGKAKMGELERLISADESLPFSATGQMSTAFTTKSVGWKQVPARYAAAMVGSEKKLDQIQEREEKKEITKEEAEKETRKVKDEVAAVQAQGYDPIRKVRELERQAVIAWIHDGHKEATYKGFVLPDKLAGQLPSEMEDAFAARTGQNFWEKDEQGKWKVSIKRIIDSRCARCHQPGSGGAQGQIHLDTYQGVVDYIPPASDTEGRGGMSLTKLAQTTHVHLLGFSMLYGLTGLIFALSSYPGLVRFVIAPLALVAQVGEISCWWLSRWDKVFVFGILGLGGIVALTVFLQIVLSLFSMYGAKGKLVVVTLLAAAGLGVGLLHMQVIGPHLEKQKTAAVKAEG